jgi:RNA polymerase sigma-70 factor (ECF subfamily)
MDLQQKQQLFQQQYPELFAYAYRYLTFRIPDQSDCEDIISNSFMQAYEKLEQFDDVRGSLQQWLTGIMKRQVVDYWRSRKLYLELDETLLLFDAIGRESLNNTIDSNLLFEKIMDNLSPEHRAMFALRYIDDYTYEQIGELVDKEPGAVRNFFSRLHKRLRTELLETSTIIQ